VAGRITESTLAGPAARPAVEADGRTRVVGLAALGRCGLVQAAAGKWLRSQGKFERFRSRLGNRNL